jgi:hypothetical protein
MKQISIIEEIPGADEFTTLREAARLSPKTSEAARWGLAGLLFAVYVRKDTRLIG